MNDDPIIRFSVPGVAQSTQPATPKRRSLGRGLEALLGDVRREEPVSPVAGAAPVSVDSGLAQLPVASIQPDPTQPRRHFDDAALDELAASIAARGVIQPVIVRPLGDGRYQLVAGERRWRAAQRAQLHEIPALVRQLSDRDVMALALIENLQREDLNPIEEARAYQRLAEQEGMTQADIARMVDKSRSHVANLQRLLALPEPVMVLVETGQLSMGHARALIGAQDAEALAGQAIDKQLSVREVEQLIRKRNRGEAAPQRRARADKDGVEDADLRSVQNHLEEMLGLSVKIAADADPRSGSVTIRYTTLDQLDLVCQRLTGGGI